MSQRKLTWFIKPNGKDNQTKEKQNCLSLQSYYCHNMSLCAFQAEILLPERSDSSNERCDSTTCLWCLEHQSTHNANTPQQQTSRPGTEGGSQVFFITYRSLVVWKHFSPWSEGRTRVGGVFVTRSQWKSSAPPPETTRGRVFPPPTCPLRFPWSENAVLHFYSQNVNQWYFSRYNGGNVTRQHGFFSFLWLFIMRCRPAGVKRETE